MSRAVVLLVVLIACAPAHAQLRGHGGPVRASRSRPTAARRSPAASTTSAIRWSLTRNAAEQVLRFHDERGECGRAAAATAAPSTGGEDGAHRDLDAPAQQQPDTRARRAHARRSSRLPFRPTARRSPPPSWDSTVRLWPLAGGDAARARGPHAERQRRRVHAGRQGGGERRLRSDAAHLAARRRARRRSSRCRRRSMRSRSRRTARSSRPAPNGKVYFLDRRPASRRGEVQAAPTPVISLAVSRDGALVAAAGIRGSVAVIERKEPQARAHAGRARACRCGRSRSCPTTARCSPAAPTAWCAAGTR